MPRETFYGHVYRVNTAADRLRAKLRMRLGLARPPTLLPYRGFGTPQRALIRGRVLEDRDLTFDEGSTWRRVAVAVRRYATFEIVAEPVCFTWNGRTYEGRSDTEGYVDLWVEPPPDAIVGENRVLGHLPRSPERVTEASVFIAPADAAYGVISDIDDTVIETGATNLLRRAHALFWAQAKHRIPFEGVAAFYRALRAGPTGFGSNPIFYLSSSPWNLHAHLVELLDMHELPRGPLLLRDWGFGPEGFAPTGKHEHKVKKAEELLLTFPDLPFVLVGDSGQEDAKHYGTIVERHPDRIVAVFLRDVDHPRTRFDGWVERIRSFGVPVVVAKTSLQAAQRACELRLVHDETVDAVQRQRRRDLTV